MKKILMIIMLLGFTNSVFAQGLDPDQITRISKSVVQIAALVNGEVVSTGSGTIVSRDGLIFTNRHVVEGADDYLILLLDDPNEPPVAQYLARVDQIFPTCVGDYDFDFATLQIDRDANGNAVLRTRLQLPFLDTSVFAEPQRGESVFTFGYPGTGSGFLVFTQGLITTVQNGDVNGERQPVWYQTDAEISSGNSGGLAVNQSGQLIGIPTAVNVDERTASGLGGILPFNLIERAIAGGVALDDSACGGASFAGGNSGSAGGAMTLNEGLGIEILDVDWEAASPTGQSGTFVRITARAQANGYAGADLRVGMFFYWDDTSELTALDCQVDDYCTPGGALTEQYVVVPDSNSASFDNLEFFVPIDAFPYPPADRPAFIVGDIGVDGVSFLSPSEPWYFTVGGSGSSASAGGSSGGAATVAATGRDITCPDGQVIEDGVEVVVVQMRPNFEYIATVVGVGGFDPVLAVTSADNTQAELCNDDSDIAANYSVNLPTTGSVSASTRSSYLTFSHSNSDFLDVSLIVGEYSRSSGEFVLILEGMAATQADGAGDPFILNVTPNVDLSPTPISVYMIGEDSALDPRFYLLDLDNGGPLNIDGEPVQCDDAATTTCWGQTPTIDGSSIMRSGGRLVNADPQDAIIRIPTGLDVTDVLQLPFVMTSYNQQSTGRYIMAFHMGVQ